MAISIPRRSRLRFKEYLSVNGVEFWELDNLPSVPENSDDVYYQVKDADRVDTLAALFYGDPNMWWVIAEANNLAILPTDLQTGSIIRIPSPTYVSEVLFTRTVS